MSTLVLLPGSPDAGWEKANAKRLRLLALAFVAVGLLWRCTRYFLAFPVWGDEAMLLVNYLTRDFGDLFGPIDNCQIAPFLFHAAALASFRVFGTGELALRLPSFLACLGSMLLFWRLARLTLPPLGRTIAIGIFAVSVWPATMGSLVKPYAFDLFASLALLVAAASWLRRPARLGPLSVLAAIVPVALWASYPAVFVAGGIGVALLPVVWRERKASAWALFIAYGVLLVAAFGSHYVLVARPHLASQVGSANTDVGMAVYWKEGFPPLTQPIAFVRWFVLAHTGQMAAYPLGSARGGSALTVLLGLIGVVALWRGSQRTFVAMVFAVFGLWFVAACLHKYPYGASCRLAQHVAPFYCLLAGLGVAVLVERWSSAPRRWRSTLVIAGLLGAVGIGGTVCDFVRPYRNRVDVGKRAVVDDLAARSGDDPILVLQPRNAIDAVFAWQLGKRGGRVLWADAIDWPDVGRTRSSLWIISCAAMPEEQATVVARLASSGETWRCVESTPTEFGPERSDEPVESCRVYHFVRRYGRRLDSAARIR